MKIAKVLCCVVSSLAAVACGTDGELPDSPSADGVQASGGQVGGGANPLVTLISGKFWGSDTLKTATLSAVTDSRATLKYQGKGSGIGEACMRDGNHSGPIPIGDGGFYWACDGGTAPYQTIAPMSRELGFTGKCADGTSPVDGGGRGGCCTGERSNVVALDAVSIWVPADAGSERNISLAAIESLFCGNADSNGTDFPTGCTYSYTDLDSGVAINFKNDGGIYRRDINSGTTNTFETLVGCLNSSVSATNDGFLFCPGVAAITDSVSGTTFPTVTTFFSDGGFSQAPETLCAAGDDATTCIGKLAAISAADIGYTGKSGNNSKNKSLEVNSVASTDANVRLILAGTPTTTPYALSRKLFFNENASVAADPQEAKFYDWVYGDGGVGNNLSAYETILTNSANDFIACHGDAGPLQCGIDGGAGVCFAPNGTTALNDGRGTGACRYTSSTNKSCNK